VALFILVEKTVVVMVVGSGVIGARSICGAIGIVGIGVIAFLNDIVGMMMVMAMGGRVSLWSCSCNSQEKQGLLDAVYEVHWGSFPTEIK